jgi:AraC-like DNA-binding protein
VLPDGCIDVIWDGNHVFVAGPDTAPSSVVPEAPLFVGLRFRPGVGPSFLGIPAVELRDRRVDLALLSTDAGNLADTLAHTSSLEQAAALLETWALHRLPDIEQPDPVVRAAARLWRAGRPRATPTWLAEQASISERQLHRRFVAAVGYGPKLLQRVLRFQAFLAVCGSPTPRLAELAYEVGYADQAHLTREARALAGLTPTQLRTARLVVRNVQDRTFRAH